MSSTKHVFGLSAKLGIFCLGLGLVPLLALGGFAVATASRSLHDAHSESMAVLNRNVVDKVQRFLGEREGDTQAFALNSALFGGDRQAAAAYCGS